MSDNNWHCGAWGSGEGNWSRHGHVQGGTHKEMPHPVISTMDGVTERLAEAGVGFCVVKVKMIVSEEVELVFCEAQFPGDVTPADGEGIVMFDDEGHGIVTK